jgi:hypothetical protein
MFFSFDQFCDALTRQVGFVAVAAESGDAVRPLLQESIAAKPVNIIEKKHAEAATKLYHNDESCCKAICAFQSDNTAAADCSASHTLKIRLTSGAIRSRRRET